MDPGFSVEGRRPPWKGGAHLLHGVTFWQKRENERIGSHWEGGALVAPGFANVKVLFNLSNCESDVANNWVLLNFHGTTCIHIKLCKISKEKSMNEKE